MKTLNEAQAEMFEGMERAEIGAGKDWNAYARNFMVGYCHSHKLVFCDEVWAAGLQEPEDMRAFGPVMTWARDAGLVENTHVTRPSVNSKLGLKPIWRSLVCGENTVMSLLTPSVEIPTPPLGCRRCGAVMPSPNLVCQCYRGGQCE